MKFLDRSQTLGLLLLAVALSGCGYNTILRADEEVKAGWAEVQNQYQRRMDLIPNLVETVKGAADFEKETLQAVIEARSKATGIQMDPAILDDPAAFQKMQQAQSQLSGALSRLMVVVERYPELRATERFGELQAQIEGTENRIAVARKRFVQLVSTYNKHVRVFPSSLTAKYILGMGERPTFAAVEGAETPPKVQF